MDVWHETSAEQSLRVDDQAQVHRIGEGRQPHEQVVFGLEDAEHARLCWASDGLGPRPPAGLVDAVVRLPEAHVQGRGERSPAETIAAGDGLPSGCVAVPAVEYDDGLADGRDVSRDRSRLRRGEVDRLVGRRVVLCERCSACCETPMLDDAVCAGGREILARSWPRRRLIASCLQGSSEFGHCGAMVARGAERVSRLLRDIGEGERPSHAYGLRAPDENGLSVSQDLLSRRGALRR